MQRTDLPARRQPDASFEDMPGRSLDPELYDGVPVRRAVAYLADVVIIFVLLGIAGVAFFFLKVLSFGLLGPLLAVAFALIPLAYHTWLIGGPRSATLGMRLMRVEVRRLDGGRPDYVLAALMTILFYVTVSLLTPLVLAVALFNPRRRCLHDYLCGTAVINALPWPDLSIEIESPPRT